MIENHVIERHNSDKATHIAEKHWNDYKTAYNAAMTMAEQKDKSFEKVMSTLKAHLDAADSSNDNEGFCEALREIYYYIEVL